MDIWNLTINISAPRIYHTSTYIPETNSVLLTGGTGLRSTERVDSSAASYTIQGNMSQIRSYHTADRISTNIVLLAGGSSVATADIYDPIAGVVTGVVPMTVARTMHKYAMFNYGGSTKVLLAGGQGPVATGDVYDSSTGTFSPVSNNMFTARWAHTATTIPNGYVIIAGGRNSSTEINSLELYNSSSNMFTPISAKLYMARYQHTATYMPSINAILFAGGWSQVNGYLNTYELFDVSTFTFIKNGTMLSRREWYTSTLLLNGLVFHIAGHDGTSNVAFCELYDPLTTDSMPAANMSFARRYHTASLMTNSGRVMVCGGQGNSGILNNCELYIP